MITLTGYYIKIQKILQQAGICCLFFLRFVRKLILIKTGQVFFFVIQFLYKEGGFYEKI